MRAFGFFVALSLLVIVTIAPARGAWFMKIATIPGASKDTAHSGWIDLQSFSWKSSSIGGALASARSMAVANDTTVVSCSTSTGSGTAVAVKRLDQSSGRLSQALARGTPLGDIEVQQTDSSGAVVLEASLSDALVSANTTTVEGDAPEQAITFVYGRIKVDSHGRDCGGSERSTTNMTGPRSASAPMPGGPH
jgi:type VI protein secretion system component Hcp